MKQEKKETWASVAMRSLSLPYLEGAKRFNLIVVFTLLFSLFILYLYSSSLRCDFYTNVAFYFF